MRTQKSTASGYIGVRTGSEGPRHDPYGYHEFECERNGKTMTLHLGLMVWLKINRELIKPDDIAGASWEAGEQILTEWFESFARVPVHKVEEYTSVYYARCKECGGGAYMSVPGYPGEELWMCKNKHIIGGTFDESAVI